MDHCFTNFLLSRLCCRMDERGRGHLPCCDVSLAPLHVSCLL
jgi:hypothetical protein